MKDPLAPDSPYDFFNLSRNATPDEIDAAYDHFLEDNPGMEREATEMWEELRNPARRLTIDIFEYQIASELNDPSPVRFGIKLPMIKRGNIAQLEKTIIDKMRKDVELKASKQIRDLDSYE